LLCSAAPAAALELDEIAKLAKGGASQLALQLLEREQPDPAEAQSAWMRWERMRVRIMSEHGDWEALAQRLAKQPEGLPGAFVDWARVHRARALLMSGRYADARQLLRALIWRQEPVLEAQQLAHYRHLVMQSYLHEGRIEDAYAAMLRFHQDYGEGNREAQLLRARVLLASGRAGESRPLLERLGDDPIARALLLLARLRSGERPAVVLEQAQAQADAAQGSAEARYLLYGTMAEAAAAGDNPAREIIALERWFRVEEVDRVWARLFHLTPDSLWQGYQAYAKRVGNREQLLLGNDEAWFRAAQNTDARYPVRIRSIYALLAENAYQAAERERAHRALIEHLLKLDNGMALVQQLYLHSLRFGGEHPVPAAVAYPLVDQAIREGDLRQASRLLQHLPEPPGDTARFAWQMRRAKVFILAGEFARTSELLTTLLPQAASLEDGQRDQFVQLLFDLQTVGEHERAYQLLAELYQRTPNYKVRRELLFWMGDSRQGQQQYAEAARLYLLSATLIDNASMDPWAQTARYQAAQSLTKARMLEDAASLYRQLLKVTESPERRAVLRRELEQLLLQQAAHDG
jgi:TolA-binding protein